MRIQSLCIIPFIICFSSFVFPSIFRNSKSNFSFLLLKVLFFLQVTFLYFINANCSIDLGGWNSLFGIQLVFSSSRFLLMICAAIVLIISDIYCIGKKIESSSVSNVFKMIFLFSMYGITMTNDLFNIYVWLEIILLSSVGMISNQIKNDIKKYFIVGIISSSIILMGIGLVYRIFGVFNLDIIHKYDFANLVILNNYYIYKNIAMFLIFTGFAMKIFLIPYIFWSAKIYSRFPSDVFIIFISISSKILSFAFIKILESISCSNWLLWISLLSIIISSIFMINQSKKINSLEVDILQRVFFYISVQHTSFIIIVGISCWNIQSAKLVDYVSIYMVLTALNYLFIKSKYKIISYFFIITFVCIPPMITFFIKLDLVKSINAYGQFGLLNIFIIQIIQICNTLVIYPLFKIRSIGEIN
jgi:formate hydrogenlyase subunit 3/multisubunit Na+/H+ antiporter MnhD subunit